MLAIKSMEEEELKEEGGEGHRPDNQDKALLSLEQSKQD